MAKTTKFLPPDLFQRAKLFLDNSLIMSSLHLITHVDDVWTIIYQDVESSLPGEQLFNPELRLWRTFKEEMKAR